MNQIEVQVLDAAGNPVEGGNTQVTLTLEGEGGGPLLGTGSASAVQGVAVFAGLSIQKAAANYRLRASAAGLSSVLSAPFDVSAAAASRLAFTVQPHDLRSGASFSELRVELRDAFGNRAVQFDEDVALTLEGGPGGAVLDGAAPRKPDAGVVTFSGLSLKTAGENYVLAASAPDVATARSQAFGVDPGEPAALAFDPQPKGTIAGEALDAFSVEIRDTHGNRSPGVDLLVTLALGNQPAGATLVGTTSRLSQGGLATFDDLELPKAGSYTLIASIPSGPSTIQAESVPFAISTGDAVKLAFLVHPADAVAMDPIAPVVSVVFRDASDNLVDSAESITLRAGDGSPAGATLSGNTASAIGGIATFPALTIDLVGTYTLVAEAEASSLESDPSDSFEIRHGEAKHLVFQQAPSNVVSLEAMSPAVEVAVLDAGGNLVQDASDPVTLSPAPGSPLDAKLSGESATPVDGVATFDTLRVDKAGTYALIASFGILQSDPSTDFEVSAGPGTVLVFSVDPSDSVAGTTFSAELAWLDEAGNPSHSDEPIDLEVADEAPALLQGHVPTAATQGVLQASTLRIDQAGEDYVLLATAGDATATSGPFDVVHGDASQIAWVAAPAGTYTAGLSLGDVTVEVQDAWKNRVHTFEDELEAELVQAPAGGALGGGAPISAQGGRATFDALWLNKTGAYELTVKGDDLLSPAPASFLVDHNDPTRLEFIAWPQVGVAGEPLDEVEVALFDDHDNLAEGSTLSVAIALLGGPGTLSGTLQQNANGGFARFGDLVVSDAGTGYKLEASAAGAAAISSDGFDVNLCPADKEACPGDVCIGTQVDDVENCGACDFDCRDQDHVASATCNGGACVFTCDDGFRDCDEDPSNGCEIDIDSDTQNCGGCGEAFRCGEGESCVSGECKVPCEGDTVADEWGNCVDPDWDPNHCGPEGKFCPNGCFQGACVEAAASASNWSHSCAVANGEAKCWGKIPRASSASPLRPAVRYPSPSRTLLGLRSLVPCACRPGTASPAPSCAIAVSIAGETTRMASWGTMPRGGLRGRSWMAGRS